MDQTIVSLSQNLLEILQNTTQNKPYQLLIKIEQVFLHAQYRSTCIFPDSNLSKIIQMSQKRTFDRNLHRTLERTI